MAQGSCTIADGANEEPQARVPATDKTKIKIKCRMPEGRLLSQDHESRVARNLSYSVSSLGQG